MSTCYDFIGPEPNSRTFSGESVECLMRALMLAATAGHTEIVELLLAAGVPAHVESILVGSRWAQSISSGLIEAVREGHVEIARLLIQFGADLNFVAEESGDCDGITDLFTALNVAVSKRHHDLAELLIVAGADVNKCHPLSDAFAADDRAMIRLLVESGADVNDTICFQIDDVERTPLNLAIQRGDESIVRLFLDRGADPTQPDGWGQSPLSVAMKGGHQEIVRILRRALPGKWQII